MLQTISVALLLVSNVGATVVKKEKINAINSETLPGNILPQFLFQQGAIEGGSVGVTIGGDKGTTKPFTPDDSCGDDIFEGAMDDMRSPQLPYLTQDLWTCDRKEEDMDVWVYENDDLKVTITPQFAGKVWGIYDKKRGKDLLYANRAHQPANIGALKAWAAGGAEWNYSPGIIGHSAFSETQVYMGRLDTEKGPVLRVYEFDRYNGTVWQVDMLLTDDALVAHPRITNPTDCDLRGYWWTCVAIDATPSTRLFTPASHVAETSRGDMRNAPWPVYAEAIENASFAGYQNSNKDHPAFTDQSYLGNHQIGDMFLRIESDHVTDISPYIAHNQEGDDGYVLVHGHPLNGTKFYTWGQSGPGRFMQDFLAGGGKGNGYYAELQVGVAPTQMQTFAVPKNATIEWTEWFKGFKGDEDVLRGDSYDKALEEVETWMKSDEGMSKSKVNDLDQFFQSIATTTPDEILVQGQPWGALEEKLLDTKLAPGLEFSLPKEGEAGYAEVQPWLELLDNGAFSASTLKLLPTSFQTTDRWLKVMVDSAGKSFEKVTWLHALHLGVAYAERGEVSRPLEMFQLSVKLSGGNPVALRCMAVLQQTQEEAWKYYQLAWQAVQQPSDTLLKDPSYPRLVANVVSELSFFLQEALWYPEMEQFIVDVQSLPAGFESMMALDGVVTLQIKSMLHAQDYSTARTLLADNCFPTYGSARDDLMNMWNTAVEGVAAQTLGELSAKQRHQARVTDPVPENIGCQYATEYCLTYW